MFSFVLRLKLRKCALRGAAQRPFGEPYDVSAVAATCQRVSIETYSYAEALLQLLKVWLSVLQMTSGSIVVYVSQHLHCIISSSVVIRPTKTQWKVRSRCMALPMAIATSGLSLDHPRLNSHDV